MLDSILEKKIKEHAEELFSSEPLLGHRERFAGKLVEINAGNEKQTLIKRYCKKFAGKSVDINVGGEQRTSYYKIITVAAVFAGCIFILHRMFYPDYRQESEPLQEVQYYYSMLLQDKIDDIEQLLLQVDEQDRDVLKKDINDMVEEAGYAYQNSDEKNAGFIVATYSSKIEALQHIQTILENNL